ncbi:MAG: hypothetical protein KDA41_17300 [Planctomycetales bacterium]|nr:hypothetical protein [Planctomycetales bacterium]
MTLALEIFDAAPLDLQWFGDTRMRFAELTRPAPAPALAVVVGPRGAQGPVGDADGAFIVTNRFSELATDTARAEARTNLGVQVIDAGTFE